MEEMVNIKDTYYNQLTIEKINEVLNKIVDQQSESDKCFNKWFENTCKHYPKFRELVDNVIREDLKDLNYINLIK